MELESVCDSQIRWADEAHALERRHNAFKLSVDRACPDLPPPRDLRVILLAGHALKIDTKQTPRGSILSKMIMQQQQTNEEICNLFIQSLEAKDEKTILKILECDDEATIRDVINRIPVHHVRKLVIELRNVLSDQLTTNHLRWLQQILVLKFSALASMADNRSILLPLISLLDDRSSPAYYMKMQALRGKISLLKQLKETRDIETQETVVRVPLDRDQSDHMEVESESETDSEDEDFDEEDEGEDEEDEEDEDINDEANLDANTGKNTDVDEDDVNQEDEYESDENI